MRGAGSIVFVVCQYWYGGEKLREEFRDLADYSRRWAIAPKTGELLLSGRLCEAVTVGETLYSRTGSAVTVKGLFAYGCSMERLDAGMTCGLLAAAGPGSEAADHPDWVGADRSLWRERMQENCGTPTHIY